MHAKYLCRLLAAILFIAVSVDTQAQTGETCETAIPITAPSLTNGSTVGMADDYNEACPFVNVNGRDIVYKFVPDITGVYDIYLCTGITNFDTKMYIYADTFPAAGTGITGVKYACSDDACTNGTTYPHEWVSAIDDLLMNAGVDYYIVVDGYDGFSTGNFTLALDPDFVNVNDVAMVDGRVYDYSEIPLYNLQPSKFEATVENLGFSDADSVNVILDVFMAGDVYGTLIFSDTSELVEVPAGATATANGSQFWQPTDTGTYVFRFQVDWEGSPDDTLSNDTIYSQLRVDDLNYRTNFLSLTSGGALALPGGDAMTEYGVAFRLYETVELEKAVVDLQTTVAGFSEQVEAILYRVISSPDSLEFIGSANAAELANPAQTRYEIDLPYLLDPGIYVLSYRGSNAVFYSRNIHTDGISNLVKHPVLTSGDWIFPPTPLAFSIGLQARLYDPPLACDTSLAPQNFAAGIVGPNLILSWDPVTASLGCRIKGGLAGSPELPKSYNVLSYELGSVAFPVVVFPPAQYEFTVKCACQLSPVLATKRTERILVDLTTARLGSEVPAAMSIYPSPARTNAVSLLLEGALAETPTLLHITDMLGRQLLERALPSGSLHSLDLENLPPGNYIATLSSGEVVRSTHFVIADR